MDNQPSFDRAILIPIGVGFFALVGICVILVAGRFSAMRATVEEVPTATPFKYALIGTEPGITTVTFEATVEEILTLPPEFATSELPGTPDIVFETPITSRLTSTAVSLTTPSLVATFDTPTATPITASTAPLGAGTYDTLDSRLLYSGDWTTQSGVAGAYQNTLHVSGTLGNSVTFRFIGQEVRIFFQAGPSLGIIRLTIDGGTPFDMNESNSSTQIYEWVLPSVSNGTHTVTITHLSGGSVNLDSIIVPEVPSTPTRTPTTNP